MMARKTHYNSDSLELVGDIMTLPRFRPGFSFVLENMLQL